jgi:amino acid transporter
MAPTLAMSITGSEASRLLGRAAPLAFLMASVGVAFVCYGFARLAAHFSHAGSVYAFAGNTLGPRAGFVTAWAYLLTYLVFPPVSIAGIALFTKAFLEGTGIASSVDWFPIALVAWAVIWVLAAQGIRPTTRSLLLFEGVSMLLILVLVGVIYARLGFHDAPGGQPFSWDFLRLPNGVSSSTVALAATVGFLSFAGFEAAGSAGEEATEPRRMIPRAIYAAVLLGAVFYVLCMVAQTLGFGTDAGGVNAFSSAPAPLGQLGRDYVGSAMADALNFGAAISALGAALGGVIVGARLVFAFSRDGLGVRRFADVSPRTGVPSLALAFMMAVYLVELLAFGLAGATVIHTFFYLATIGVLSLLLMYVSTNAGAFRLLVLQERRYWELLPIMLGAAFAAYTFYRNVYPVPAHPFNVFPYVVGGWIAVGIVITLLVPGFTRRIGAQLAERSTGP